MSSTIVAHASDNPNRDRRPVPLIRGTFTDSRTNFTVWTSSAPAPDAFQVAVTDNPADLVLIVSGLNTGLLHATWGDEWRAFVPEWKDWVRDAAFQVFHTGRVGRTYSSGDPAPNRPIPGEVRFCDG